MRSEELLLVEWIAGARLGRAVVEQLLDRGPDATIERRAGERVEAPRQAEHARVAVDPRAQTCGRALSQEALLAVVATYLAHLARHGLGELVRVRVLGDDEQAVGPVGQLRGVLEPAGHHVDMLGRHRARPERRRLLDRRCSRSTCRRVLLEAAANSCSGELVSPSSNCNRRTFWASHHEASRATASMPARTASSCAGTTAASTRAASTNECGFTTRLTSSLDETSLRMAGPEGRYG
jgi:hypothetical protein